MSLRVVPVVAIALCALASAGCDDATLHDYQPPLDGSHDLFVVAHEDDDLLFMNPDLSARLRAGHEVETVFLTAGDAGQDEALWLQREAGIKAAYAYMADVEDAWSESALQVAGKTVVRFQLEGAPRVRVVFLRLPDGNLDGSGFGHGSLLALWKGRIDKLPVLGMVAPTVTYSHAELVDVLIALMIDAAADQVHTLDSTGLYSRTISDGDHSDHVVSARLALEASLAYAAPHVLSMYRTYNLSQVAENLSEAQFDDKREAYQQYNAKTGCADVLDLQACLDRPDSYPHAYGEWMHRLVAIRAHTDFSAALEVSGDGCLVVARDGTGVRMGRCGAGPARRWTATHEGELRGPGDRCLSAREPLALEPCDGSRRQKWRVLDNGQIRGLGATCLDARRDLHGDAVVTRRDCARAPGQIWRERNPLETNRG